MSLKSDSYRLDTSEPGIVHIAYSAEHSTSFGPHHETASLWLERGSASKIAAALRTVLGDEQHDVENVASGADVVKVFWAGNEVAPYMKVSNERTGDPHPGYHFIAMAPETAQKLAGELAGL